MNRNFGIKELVDVILKRFVVLLLALLLFGIGGFLYSTYFIDPVYQSKTTLIVNSDPRLFELGTVDQSTLNASQTLANTCTVLLKSDTILDAVAADCMLPYSAGKIKNMMSVSVENNTQILKLTISANNSEHAAIIASSFAKVAPDQLVELTQAGSVKVIDTAKVASAPSSPNITMNTIIAAFAGFFLTAVILILIEFLDTTVKDEKDLRDAYTVPVIGTIPKIESN